MSKAVKQLKIDKPSDPDYSDIGIFRPKVIDLAMIQFGETYRYWRPIYNVSQRDKSFLQTKQWDKKTIDARARAGKLSSTAPLIGAYFREKMGHLLPGNVEPEVVPVRSNYTTTEGGDRDNETSCRILSGAIKYIDHISGGKSHRNRARKEQCAGGIGWLSIAFEETPGASDGEIVFKSPRLSSSIYIDPYPECPDFSDARYSFQIFPMSWAELKGKYGDKVTKIREKKDVDGQIGVTDVFTVESFDGLCNYLESTIDGEADNKHLSRWIDRSAKEINVAVWYRRVESEETFYLLDNGRELEQTDFDSLIAETEGNNVADIGLIDVRKETGWRVERRVITGWTVLEEDKNYFIDSIPHVPVLGYTVYNDDDTTYHSILHDGVDLQEKINILESNGMKKAAEAKATALIPHGVAPDKVRKVMSTNNMDFIGIDPTASGIWSDKSSGIQVIQNPDNGSVEFAQIPIHIDMLRQVLGINNNDSRGTINSAAQLQLQLEQEIIVFSELDANFQMAMKCLYRKALSAVVNTTDEGEFLRIIDMENDKEVFLSEQLPGDYSSMHYDVDVKISQSGQVERRNERIFMDSMASADPILRTAVIPELIRNSPVQNKDRTLANWARVMVADGKAHYLPPDLLGEALQELQQTGQLGELIQNQAEAIAAQLTQQQIAQIMGESSAQAALARAQADMTAAQSKATIAEIQAAKSMDETEKAIIQDGLQVQQQEQQTQQDVLRTEKERIGLQKQLISLQHAIAKADAQSLELAQKEIDHLNDVLAKADLIAVTVGTA